MLPPVFLAWPLGFAVAGVSRQDPSAIGGSAEEFAYAYAHSTTWCQTPRPQIGRAERVWKLIASIGLVPHPLESSIDWLVRLVAALGCMQPLDF